MDKIISTLITVVIAVIGSAALWVGANMVFDRVRDQWRNFNALAGAVVGAIVFGVARGNRLFFSDHEFLFGLGSDEATSILSWLLWPVVGAVAMGAAAIALAETDDPQRRLAIGAGSGLAIGVGLGACVNSDLHPGLDPAQLVGWTVVLAGIGAAAAVLRSRDVTSGAMVGGAIGFFLGAWGGADLGDGSIVESIIATAVPFAVLGTRIGRTSNPDLSGRAQIDSKSRAVIFLAPSLLFIFASLIVPTIRTAYLSLLDNDSEGFVGLENYGATFTDTDSFDASDIGNIVTSRLFLAGAVVLAVGIFAAVRQKTRTGTAVELGGPSITPLLIGGLGVLFAILTGFRGTIPNNLWWVVTVTALSTGLGLAVAVLADRARAESLAKSLIFMPMAISLVSASVIWRFMYVARDTSKEQTGVMNAIWVGLGNLSTGEGLPTLIFGAVLVASTLGLLALTGRSLVKGTFGGASITGVLGAFLAYTTIQYFGDGIGGLAFNNDGERVAATIGFLQERPFNNLWLMVILIWIQTGFAMVILSAAIKAVPTELLEAARVDGANETQIFWRVTLPQIASTIGVVVTTLIVLVMKVFDIVKVTTNGQFGTPVLANDMFNQAFQFGNTGRGAALAVILFLSVLPVMVFNVRKMQEET